MANPYEHRGKIYQDYVALIRQVSAQFIGLPVALPHIKSGKLRALAVTSARRAAAAADIPAVAETLKGYD